MNKFLDLKIYEVYNYIKIWHVCIFISIIFILFAILQVYRHISYKKFKENSNKKMVDFKENSKNSSIYDIYGRIKK